MKIHQITHLFHPDMLAGAALYTDFARMMQARGHDLRVTTTFSYYPRLQYLEQDRGLKYRDEVFDGIPVRRVAMTLPKKHQGWRRLIPEISYLRALQTHGAIPGWAPDVVVTACPMMAQALAARRIYRGRRSVPVLLIVQDLMADAALRLGIIRQRWLGRMLVAAEKRALVAADHIVTISEEMSRRLLEITSGQREVSVIPNWIHDSLAAEASRVDQAGVPLRSLTLFYSGNVGVKQGLPDFLDDFAAMKSGWTLDIHGDGAEVHALRAACERCTGVALKPLLPEMEYVRALAGSAACLITQRRGAGESFLPSKLLPALATGTPVLAVCEETSPLGREVLANGFGVVVGPGDREKLESTLKRWREQPGDLMELSTRAKQRAEVFQREKALAAYEKLLVSLATKSMKPKEPV